MFRTLNRHRFTAEEGAVAVVVEDDEDVIFGMLVDSSPLICTCCVVDDGSIIGGALIADDLLWLLKHDLRVVINADGVDADPITAVAAATDDDACSMTGISSIGKLGFGFINGVDIAEPFLPDTEVDG